MGPHSRDYQQALAATRAALGEGALAAALAAGRALSRDEVIAEIRGATEALPRTSARDQG